MKTERIELVAFDCDGVMFDTAEANRIYYSRLLQHLGRPPVTDQQFEFVHMHTLDESMSFLFPDPADLAAAYEFRRGIDYRQLLQYFTVEPHLEPVLKKLRPRRKTAIATNRTDSMDQLLEAFDLTGYFDLVVTSSDVERPKPHPESLQRVLRYFGLMPDQTIYVGDSPLDESAARSAGIPFVAYRNRKLASKYHIDSLKDLEALLRL
jgi:HAD superfamily hydrolase (TIGR01509 family)